MRKTLYTLAIILQLFFIRKRMEYVKFRDITRHTQMIYAQSSHGNLHVE